MEETEVFKINGVDIVDDVYTGTSFLQNSIIMRVLYTGSRDVPDPLFYRIPDINYRIANFTGYRIIPDISYRRIPDNTGYQIVPGKCC